MDRTFVNTTNNYRETVGISDGIATLFLGPLWYFHRGLYAIGALDILIYAIAILLMTSPNNNTAGAAFFFLFLPVHLMTTLGAPKLVAHHFAQQGWREEGAIPAVPVAPAADPAEKTCPMCAETVKTAALVCKHCGHTFFASN